MVGRGVNAMRSFCRPANLSALRPPRTLFLFNGPSGRLIICETRDIAEGLLELRLEWADEVVGSNVFAGRNRQARAEAAAEEWRQWLLEHGFTEADPDIPVMGGDIRFVIPFVMLVLGLLRFLISGAR